MWKEIKIHADPNLETHCNEQPNPIPQKINWECVIFWTIGFIILLGFAIFIVSAIVLSIISVPDQIRISIISVPVSGLNPNASSSPVFHIVFQVEKAFENGIQMCLHRISTTISYHDIEIARAVEDKLPCYDMKKWSEFVIPVPMLVSVPRYLQKQLWKKREITVLDLEMVFKVSSTNYHVSCNTVIFGAIDTPIPCNATT